MTYYQYLSAIQFFEHRVKSASLILREVCGDTQGGLTPDHIKKSDDYKKAKRYYDATLKSLQLFNKNVPDRFKKKRVEEARQLKLKAKGLKQ